MRGNLSILTTQTLSRSLEGRALEKLLTSALSEARQLSVVIYHRDGSIVAPLTPDRPLAVGRVGSAADLAVRDPSVSRLHARFELIDGEAWVEDLGSTNGTRVNEETVTRARVAPGDRVWIGSVPAVIGTLSPLEEGLYGLDGHETFRVRVEEELYRSRTFGRRFALLMIAPRTGAGDPLRLLHRFCPEARRRMRPIDRMGLFSPGIVEALVPEATDDALRELVDAMEEVGAAVRVPIRCGVALCPDHAASAEELYEAVRVAFQGTRRGPAVAWSGRADDAPDGAEEATRAGMRSRAMQRIDALIERVAPANLSVLIQGETGAGKEVVARAVHERSERRERPLLCVNCGAIQPELVASALFGHEKGAFTGAVAQTRGVFEAADGGTVLLDELGDMPLDAQAALLRAIDTRRITRVGSTREIAVDVRVIAATHRDLQAMVAEGTFREDLYFRLNVVTIEVPPLRERLEELPALVSRFIEEAREASGTAVSSIDGRALALLGRYPWPGNIRELRNVIERGVVIAQGAAITVDDLPRRVCAFERAPRGGAAPAAGAQAPAKEAHDLSAQVQQYESGLITIALKQTGWDRAAAAELLGIPLRTLSYKMRNYGIRILRRERE